MIRKKLWLVQKAVWDIKDTGLGSMPLASGYLKAMADSDERIHSEMDVKIFGFDGSDTVISMIQCMFSEEIPDIIGFSVYGWNLTTFGKIAETFRMYNPNGWVIFG
jgi:hypothetical protein